MSKIALTPNASGTGTLTIAAPNTNTDRTITLPDATSTLATTADVAAAAGSLTLLGTIATTSGSSVTLSGLTLTSYKQLQCVFTGVSSTATFQVLLGGIVVMTNLAATSGVFGFFTTDLATGIFQATSPSIGSASINTSGSGLPNGGIQNTITTASTSITFTVSAGTFDAGSIRIYGVK